MIDISNPLDFFKAMPPSLFICNTDSLGEHLQNALAEAHVVKKLNIVHCEVMVNPKKSNGDPTMFVCGNEADAKNKVKEILTSFDGSILLIEVI